MDNISENNSLFGFDGILNRRNYIANILLVETIVQALIATPLLIAVFKSNNLTGAILGDGQMPVWWLVVMSISSFLCSAMYMPSIIKRFRDIMGSSGEDNVKSLGILAFIVLVLGIPSAFTKDLLFSVIKIAGLTILISLAFIKGKITGTMPKNEIAKFNWGAFIGTWIWGLFNKSYKTLWALPLTFTLGAMPFYIVCGLKGNEWAYEKSENKDVKIFHSRQKLQTVIWAVIFPIILFLLLVFGSVFVYKLAANYSKSHPDFVKQAVEYYVKTESEAAMSKFDRIEIGENEYKFYINPKKWAKSSFKEKVSNFDMASGYVMLQKLDKNNIMDTFSASSSSNIMNKIKIYSTYNDELLGEYYLDSEIIERFMTDIKDNPEKRGEILEEIKKGYRFNSNPTLP